MLAPHMPPIAPSPVGPHAVAVFHRRALWVKNARLVSVEAEAWRRRVAVSTQDGAIDADDGATGADLHACTNNIQKQHADRCYSDVAGGAVDAYDGAAGADLHACKR